MIDLINCFIFFKNRPKIRLEKIFILGSKLSANNPKSDYDFDHETFMTQSLNGNLWPQSPRSKVRSIPLNNGNGSMSMSVDRGTLQVRNCFKFEIQKGLDHFEKHLFISLGKRLLLNSLILNCFNNLDSKKDGSHFNGESEAKF